MPATLKDIAKLTGLSVPSVCLILNGQGHKFRPESRSAVVEAARKLKYRPDMVMRRMGRASNRRDAIGLVIRSQTGDYLADQPAHEFLAGVHDALVNRDQLLVLARLGAADANGKPPRIIAERFVDGLLMVESGLSSEVEDLIEHYEIFSVSLNTEKRSDNDCVYADDRFAGSAATEALLHLGHRRIAFASVRGADAMGVAIRRFASDERQRGYETAMRPSGHKPEVIGPAPGSDAPVPGSDAASVLKRILDSRKTDAPITGVVAASLGLAIRLIEELTAAGLKCPEDVSVVSAGDLKLFHAGWGRVTRVSCDRAAIGAAAAEMLLTKIERDGAPQPSRVFRGRLVEGSTAGPAPGR